MSQYKILSVLFLSTLLNACSGGSFDTSGVSRPTPTTPNNPKPTPVLSDKNSKPRPQDETNEFLQPSLGFSMQGVRRDSKSSKSYAPLKNHALKKISTADVEDLENGPWRSLEEFQKYDTALKDTTLDLNNDYANKHYKIGSEHKFKNIELGYISNLNFSNNSYTPQKLKPSLTNAYYFGNNPSSKLPTNKSVTYKGSWGYLTDAKKDRNFKNDLDFSHYDQAINTYADGSNTSGVALEDDKTRFKSKFNVNFADKKLQGDLNYTYKSTNTDTKNTYEDTVYNIDAKIIGNRFKGSAKINDEFKNGKNKQLQKIATTDSTNKLEGGFYGSNAGELAGKFMTDDSSLFGVFGAKKDENQTITTETILDSVSIDESTLKTNKLDNFGNPLHLRFGGKIFNISNKDKLSESLKTQLSNHSNLQTIQDDTNKTITVKKGDDTLMTVCCSNLNYIRFGRADLSSILPNTKASLFMQGERTKTSDMPVQGNVTYKGTWNGFISASSNYSKDPSMADAQGKSQFAVNFTDKTLNGGLYRVNGTQEVISLSGGFEGNQFTSVKASANNFNLDPKNTITTNTVSFNDVDVKGGFYGPEAIEMGGHFTHKIDQSKDHKLGIVFGAIQQEKK